MNAPLARRNPVAKVGAALVLTLALIATIDPVAPALALAVELATVPLFGLRYGALLRRVWPILLAAGGVTLSLVLFSAERTGVPVVDLGPFHVTTGLLTTALGLSLRLLAVALPGVLVFATTDPTDLADALVANVKAPPRFAIGALAAFRLLPLLADEWETLRLARRARGIDTGPLRSFAPKAFALLVGAIRRGTRLATAMDARGFDSGLPRTIARPQPFRAADVALVVAAVVTGAAVLAASVALGTFRPLL